MNINAAEAPNSLIITGNAGDNTLIGTRFADVLIGGEGNDVTDGRDGSDIYLLQYKSQLYPYEVVRDTGRASDRDELRIASTRTIADPIETWDLPALIGLERVTIGQGLAVDADVSGFGGISVSASLVANPLTIIGNNGRNRLVGTDYGDWIQGNGSPDTLVGGGGDDVLIGGPGLDQLEGGSGRDSFLFDSDLDGYFDQIMDFTPGVDRIQLSRRVFVGLPSGSTLSADAFQLGATAGLASHRILYDRTMGTLSYDRDGNGGAFPGIFAQILIVGRSPLSAADFLIVA